MFSYLLFMASRLKECYRILKETGSLYLHCDLYASHYLKQILDAIFNQSGFRNEIVWCYGKMNNSSKNYPKNHDTIFYYTKSDDYTFNKLKKEDSEYKNRWLKYVIGNKIRYGNVKHKQDKMLQRRIDKVSKKLGRQIDRDDILFDFDEEFKQLDNNWVIPIIKGNSKERTGYPTQKPIKLLKRIIEASSNTGDVVFDPFCGCATTCLAAEELGRKWVGIDISKKAYESN